MSVDDQTLAILGQRIERLAKAIEALVEAVDREGYPPASPGGNAG